MVWVHQGVSDIVFERSTKYRLLATFPATDNSMFNKTLPCKRQLTLRRVSDPYMICEKSCARKAFSTHFRVPRSCPLAEQRLEQTIVLRHIYTKQLRAFSFPASIFRFVASRPLHFSLFFKYRQLTLENLRVTTKGFQSYETSMNGERSEPSVGWWMENFIAVHARIWLFIAQNVKNKTKLKACPCNVGGWGRWRGIRYPSIDRQTRLKERISCGLRGAGLSMKQANIPEGHSLLSWLNGVAIFLSLPGY